jgi:hypothetical protein
MVWHEQRIEEALKNLGARMEGLTEIEAQERLERYGKNEIIRGKPLIKFCDMFAASGVVHTGKRCFRGSSIGLASLGGYDPGGGSIVRDWRLYDQVDTKTDPSVGRLNH